MSVHEAFIQGAAYHQNLLITIDGFQVLTIRKIKNANKYAVLAWHPSINKFTVFPTRYDVQLHIDDRDDSALEQAS